MTYRRAVIHSRTFKNVKLPLTIVLIIDTYCPISFVVIVKEDLTTEDFFDPLPDTHILVVLVADYQALTCSSEL